MGWLSDIGNAIASGASAVGDAVEDVVDAYPSGELPLAFFPVMW